MLLLNMPFTFNSHIQLASDTRQADENIDIHGTDRCIIPKGRGFRARSIGSNPVSELETVSLSLNMMSLG